MSRLLVLVYGTVVYAFFLATFLYAMGFCMGLVVPRTIDSGPVGPVGIAIAVNAMLLGAFAIQHMIMARPGFKQWWTRIIPPAAERSTFVLVTCLILCTLFWQWRAMPAEIWHVEATWARGVLRVIELGGWGIVLYATFLIDHFDLFGLRQVWMHFRGRDYRHKPFSERSLYRLVRHPLMLGFLVAFWCTPDMTVGRLLYAVLTTAFILVALQLEERDLVGHLGDAYRRYQARTPMLIPLLKVRRGPGAAVSIEAT